MAEDKEILPPWYNTECETCGGSYYATRADPRPRPELLECEGCSEFRRGEARADAAMADLRARAEKAEALLTKVALWAEYRAAIYPKVVQRDDGDELEVQDMKVLAVQDMLDIARMAKGEDDR